MEYDIHWIYTRYWNHRNMDDTQNTKKHNEIDKHEVANDNMYIGFTQLLYNGESTIYCFVHARPSLSW